MNPEPLFLEEKFCKVKLWLQFRWRGREYKSWSIFNKIQTVLVLMVGFGELSV